MIPGTDPGAPPPRAPEWQPDDEMPAVEPGVKPSPVVQATQAAAPPKPIPTTKWAEVIAKPQYQGLSPEQKEQVRNAYWSQVVVPRIPPNLAPDQQKLLRQAFDRDTLPKDGPQASGGTVGKVLDHMLGMVAGPTEVGWHVGSGLAALPVEAAASVYKLATAPPGLKAKEAAEASETVGSAMTYQPRTPEGQALSGAVDRTMGVIPKVADKLTGDIAEDPTVKQAFGPTGSAVAQGVANTAYQALPTLLGARGAKGAVTEAGSAARTARAATSASRAAEGITRAKAFVAKKTSLKWDQLPESMQKKLAQIAEDDPDALFRLKPEAIERQARLTKLKTPATRGEVERDLTQLTREENMSKQPAGADVREIHAAQDEALHHQLDVVRRSTGGKAVTRQQVGKTVQNDGLRNKAAVSVKNYDRLYKEARAEQPNATVKADPFYEFLEQNGEVLNPNVQHLSFLKSWLNKAKLERPAEGSGAPISLSTDVAKAVAERGKSAEEEGVVRRPIKLVELDDLRRKASSIARKGGTDAHYAGELLKAIDKSFEQIPAAATKWKAARDAFKAHKVEFEDQALVKKLTSNKGKSRTDRATALEDTTETVLKHSAEDISKLEKSLKEGGTPQTQAAGKRAWANLQAGVIDYLREKASGKRAISGEKGQKQFNAPYRDVFGELDADGKIDALFGKAQAKRLREIYEAVGDVRTKPTGRIAGSDTAARQALSKAEAASSIPVVGKPLAIAGKLGGKLMDLGEEARQGRRAKSSELDDAAKKARKRNKARGKGRYTLKSIQASGAAHRATLKDDKKDESRQ